MQRAPFIEIVADEEIYELPSWDLPGLRKDANYMPALPKKSNHRPIRHPASVRAHRH